MNKNNTYKEGVTSYFKMKKSCNVNPWEYALKNNGKLPLDQLDEISQEERLADKEGKTMSYFVPNH